MEIRFMSRKEVEAEERKKINDMFENDYFAKLIAGGVFMGFKFETLARLNAAAKVCHKEPNEFVMELLEKNNGN